MNLETWWDSTLWLFHLESLLQVWRPKGVWPLSLRTPSWPSPPQSHDRRQSDCSSQQIASGWATQSHTVLHTEADKANIHRRAQSPTNTPESPTCTNTNIFYWKKGYLTPMRSLLSKPLPVVSTYRPWLPLWSSFLHFPSDILHWRKTPPPCWPHVLFRQKQ